MHNGDSTHSKHIQAIIARRAATDASHARSNREALLEHARMGREVCEARDGKVVWIPPAEIFARYGFDEFGRPVPVSAPAEAA